MFISNPPPRPQNSLTHAHPRTPTHWLSPLTRAFPSHTFPHTHTHARASCSSQMDSVLSDPLDLGSPTNNKYSHHFCPSAIDSEDALSMASHDHDDASFPPPTSTSSSLPATATADANQAAEHASAHSQSAQDAAAALMAVAELPPRQSQQPSP